jgi:DNA-binding NarL/FixJ family response regulator
LLITDREPAPREAILGLLPAAPGFDFIGVVSPEEAIRQATIDRANVVLLDVIKPYDMSVKLCQSLCALSPAPIVIAFTTLADPAEEKALLNAGAAGYLLKEVRLEKLIHAIRQIVAHERSTLDRLPSTRKP